MNKTLPPGSAGVILISLGLLLPGVLMHTLVREVPGTLPPADYDLPLAYTWSIAFYALPALMILVWLFSSAEYAKVRRSVFISLLFLIPLGMGMNLLFAGFFFDYPNRSANLKIDIPAIGGSSPLEDFIFYTFSFPFLVFIYVWADGSWLSAYHRPAKENPASLRFSWKPIPWLVAAVGAAIAYRFLLVEENGFPGYFTYVFLIAILPAACLLGSVKDRINWQAFGITHVLMVLVCMEWEATFAMPYGFWGFREEMMTGIYLPVWHYLPLEQIIVWFVAPFVNIVIYEAVRLKVDK